MARGIERRDIFVDDADRESLLQRLGRLVEAQALEVFAWVLMPNHFHLLVRTRREPLSWSMRRLLTGHAVYFNRRHGRVGHLFQNRFKSIICEEEPYFLELVRYIHLNPIRAGIVEGMAGLETYRYSGHRVLIGQQSCSWQSMAAVLRHFGRNRSTATLAYRDFVRAGVTEKQTCDLSGGGLVRSAGGWAAVKSLRRGREEFESDERILGSRDFVCEVLGNQLAARDRRPKKPTEIPLEELLRKICEALGLDPSAHWLRSKKPLCSRARRGVAFVWIHRLGRSGKDLGRALGIHPANIYRAAERGRRDADLWDAALAENP